MSQAPASPALPPASLDQLFITRGEFELKRLTLISEATQTLWLSAYDCQDWQLDSPTEQEALRNFLLAVPSNKLMLLLGDDRFLATRAARFARTREMFSSQIECRLSQGRYALTATGEELVIADARHMLRRVAPPRFRARMILDAPEQCEALLSNYRRLWDEAIPCLPTTSLGI